jgi:uncharacterized protein
MLSQVLFLLLIKFFATLLPGFGEEFGWRGYLLPHLVRKHTPRKAILLQSLIWWAWHLPVIVGIGIQQGGTGSNLIITVIAVIIINPDPRHSACRYSYIWAKARAAP